jgi:hypothetical protein
MQEDQAPEQLPGPSRAGPRAVPDHPTLYLSTSVMTRPSSPPRALNRLLQVTALPGHVADPPDTGQAVRGLVPPGGQRGDQLLSNRRCGQWLPARPRPTGGVVFSRGWPDVACGVLWSDGESEFGSAVHE